MLRQALLHQPLPENLQSSMAGCSAYKYVECERKGAVNIAGH
jgi:hypothetical protein